MHYVYVLRDPETLEVRYVGQTRRLDARRAQHTKHPPAALTEVAAWCRDLVDRGTPPVFEVVASVECFCSDSLGTRWPDIFQDGAILTDACSMARTIEDSLIKRCRRMGADLLNSERFNRTPV